MNQVNKILLLIALISIFQSCAFYKIPKLVKQGEVKNSNYLQETQFNFTKQLIFFEVEIEGKKYNFIFDTGAELSVIGKHIADDISYKKIADSKVNATKKSENKLAFIEVPKITIASVEFENIGAIIADISEFDEYFACKSVDEIIGNNLMRKAAWQIDYKGRKITISDNVEKLNIAKNASEITMNSGKMKNVYFDVMIDNVSSKFTFDTGYNGKIQADSNFFKLLMAENEGLEYSAESGIAVKDLHGKIMGKTFNMIAKNVDIEGLELRDQLISLTGINKYLIGNEFYKNYILTVDWKNDKLFFEPSNEILADTLKGYEFTFYPNFTTRKFEILRFREDYTLDEEISYDAEIIMINDIDVSNFSLEELCAYWESEGKNLLLSKSIDLVILDKGVSKKLKLTEKVLLAN